MTDFRPPTATTKLMECPLWPTMHWVPPQVMVRLEENVRTLRMSGRAARRADVVGARILASPPPAGEVLAEHLERYRRKHHEYLKPSGNRAALMMRIPSAVSLRLDTMVTGVRSLSLPAYRHEVIGTLILDYEPASEAKLATDFNDYRRSRVEDLVAPDAPLSSLLHRTTPEPGPRPR